MEFVDGFQHLELLLPVVLCLQTAKLPQVQHHNVRLGDHLVFLTALHVFQNQSARNIQQWLLVEMQVLMEYVFGLLPLEPRQLVLVGNKYVLMLLQI